MLDAKTNKLTVSVLKRSNCDRPTNWYGKKISTCKIWQVARNQTDNYKSAKTSRRALKAEKQSINAWNIVVAVQNCVTALHVASKWGHRNIVQLLLNHSADIDCPTGVSPLSTYYLLRHSIYRNWLETKWMKRQVIFLHVLYKRYSTEVLLTIIIII